LEHSEKERFLNLLELTILFLLIENRSSKMINIKNMSYSTITRYPVYSIIFLMTSIVLFSCVNTENDSYVEHKLVIDTMNRSGLGKWYTIEKQFINRNKCKGNKKYASAYVCTMGDSADSFVVISPCDDVEFKLKSNAVLFEANNTKTGDSLILKIPIFISSKLTSSSVFIGNLRIPIE
jgi:hypothetical protein